MQRSILRIVEFGSSHVALAVRVVSIFLPLGLAACQSNPETAHLAANPHTPPVRTITSFNEALRCMDELFLAQGKKDIYITSAGIPDATGQIAAGTKEMLITAIAKMSARSGAFRFVDFDPTQIDVQMLSELVGLRPGFVAPNYYIRGAVTQLDSSVLSSNASAGVSAPMVEVAAARGQIVSVMSVDLNLGQLVTRQIIPGMSASNSIAIVRTSQGGTLGGVIGKVGLSFNVEFDQSEGFHQGVRNLIELSSIESLGKLTRVPYWKCLEIDQANPTYRTEAREWFDAMTPAEKLRNAEAGLTRAGYYRGPPTDEITPELRDAVARYQAEHDLIASGRIDFDLYSRLLADAGREKNAPTADLVSTPAPTPPAAPTTGTAVSAAPKPTPPALRLSSDRGDRPSYHVNETLALKAVTSGDAYLYCYYQDSGGTVARIFPNRFQPDALIHSGAPVEIPPRKGNVFAIRFDKSHTKEAVACIASTLELGIRLPDKLKAQDLTPLPVRGLQDVVGSFKQLGGGQITEGWLPIEVM